MTKTKQLIPAFAYLRTSSATNVGHDKDSDKRQREAIAAFARAASYRIVGEYYDAAVSGADPVGERAGFAAMLAELLADGVRTIIVESADRFARDLMVQLAGHDMLKKRGITLIAASAPTHFLEDTPTATLVRQVLGAVSQWEKSMLVAKLKGARDRIRQQKGRCDGRPPAPEAARELAKRLHRQGLSLRAVAKELEAAGWHSVSGGTYGPQSIKAMLDNRAEPGQ